MKSVANVTNKKRKAAKKRKIDNSSVDQRVQKSKMNDPLLNPSAASSSGAHDDDGGDDGDGDGNDEGGEADVVDHRGSANDGGMSGRKEWKARHKKGKFNPLMAKHNEHRQQGSFIKSKNYK